MIAVLRIAASFLGTHNGATFTVPLGLPKAAAWCMSFVVFCTVGANPASRIPRTGRCFTAWQRMSANPLRFQVIEPEAEAWGIDRPEAGDVVFFAHNPNVANWDGHAGLVVELLPNGHVRTIEGNTSPTDKGDQRMGGTVAYKERRTGLRNFALQGYVRERR